MKKNIFILIAIAICWSGWAQTTYTGNIKNTNNTSLTGVDIISKNGSGVATNNEGNFTISLTNPTVTISHIGYKTLTTTLSSTFNQLTLEVNEEHLDEVVISASREQQKRKEVPAAITVINAQTIKETKAFGIEQIVNQVPGVFMSTSKTSSNEQHFMSVRSPISTKSLFLYVEDGLPIRPTAVFNHNALLEMNSVSFDRVEVLKGPASSIYGSEAIGGSFNYITKKPTEKLEGGLSFQLNDLGFKRYEFDASKKVSENFGFYFGAQYSNRENGPIEHSDYEKLALTFKTVSDFSETTKWTNVIDLTDYRSDMSGSLSEADYSEGNYESDQTFTEREALAFRFRSTLDQYWNNGDKTSFNFIFRDNRMDQIPSYRIKQLRNQGQLTGFGSGEINSNQFQSLVGLLQHKINFNSLDASLIIGTTADYSPQDYVAETISVIVDPLSGRNTSYVHNLEDFILNYEADILNYAAYFQYEISPLEALKLTTSLRYDKFIYDYNNLVDGQAGARDTKTDYNNFAPKLGTNYNFSNKGGLYANYSNGFTPPQTSSLYRNSLVGVGGEVFELKPSKYHNYEIGGYFMPNKQWKLDIAAYLLEGKNTLVTLRDENDEFYNANAGQTRSLGVEYGITFNATTELSITHNGSFAKHRYINFFDSGTDYSNTDMETAPKLLGMTLIKYKPAYFPNFILTAEHEMVGKYNTSFQNQIDNGDGTFDTATYDGHNIINLRASYSFKKIELWMQALNILDDLYAVRASFNRYRSQNSYSIGNPRAFHAGIKYSF